MKIIKTEAEGNVRIFLEGFKKMDYFIDKKYYLPIVLEMMNTGLEPALSLNLKGSRNSKVTMDIGNGNLDYITRYAIMDKHLENITS